MVSSNLILSARQGNRQALELLLAECQPDIQRYALTMKEIADRLHISVANAKVRLHRARFLVREYLLS